MRKRNLLFLFTDEQRADTMAAYGNKKIDVPHLNRLADDSVVFEKCYVSQPVCTPSRSTIMTGLWPHTNGCIANNIPLGEDTRCLPEMTSGYRTAYFGKWHLGDEIFAQHGFEHWISIEDMYRKYYREGKDRDARSTYHHWLVAKGYKPNPDDGVFGRRMTAGYPEPDCKPAYLAVETSRWLWSLGKDEPFIGYVNFLEPHMPFTGPRDDQYPLDFVDLPKNFADIPGESNPVKARMLHALYTREGFGGVSLDNEAGWRRLIANYWGLVSQVDAAVGTILETLHACGKADDTIIVYTSDHGDMMGSHQLLAKTVMYEEAATVPLLIKAPGLRPRVERQVVSQVDLVPTLLDMMGEEVPEELPGQSLAPLLGTGVAPGQRDVFIEWNGRDSGASKVESPKTIPEYLAKLASPEVLSRALRDPVRTVITADRWKLNHSPDMGEHELYDLNADPYERHNLYGQAAHADRVAAMRNRLTEWGRRCGDDAAAGI